MNCKYNLMLCELHNPNIHGKNESSANNIETHYLVYDRFEPWSGISYLSFDEEYDTDDTDDTDEDNPNHVEKLEDTLQFLRDRYSISGLQNRLANHPSIRNYRNIISKPDYIKPEIGQYIILPTLEAVTILKTFWLRIVQRRWKNVFLERQRVKTERQHCASLSFRQINGAWPPTCAYMPSLDGMLQDLL